MHNTNNSERRWVSQERPQWAIQGHPRQESQSRMMMTNPNRQHYGPAGGPNKWDMDWPSQGMPEGYQHRYRRNEPSNANRNMRGKDNYRVNVGPRPEGDTTGLGGLINRLDTGNVGYGYMLNRILGLPFDQEVIDWQDKYGSDYSPYTGNHMTESHISSERQPGLEEGIMGAIPGEYETSGLWQTWKKILNRTKNVDLANDWLASQQAV